MIGFQRRRSACDQRPARKALAGALCILACLTTSEYALGWPNVLQDPGFEQYRLDPRGFYVPTRGAAWQEITLGRGSVQIDINDWHAPDEMVAERPLGFTPCTTKYEGDGPQQNTGRLIFQQDVVDPRLFPADGKHYEAWVWLGGAGRDDDNNADVKDEAGGWEVFFYGNDDPSTWNDAKPLEHHQMIKDFWGPPGSFVKVAGFGKIPAGTKGIRMQVWATTWGQSSQPAQRGDFATEVALDNAHFAIIEAPNMLINGDFELDDRPAEFKGWQRPAAWPFPRNGLKPLDVNDVFDGNFDHGQYRPFYGARRSYGYVTYLSGWRKDAFTFGQYADYVYPDGTPLVLMFYWIQAAQRGGEVQLRLIGSKLEVVVEYRGEAGQLGAQSFWVEWPVPAGAAAVGRYDQNSGTPFCPRLLLDPPAGTRRVGVHVNFMVHAPYRDGFRLMNAAVDDFFLAPVARVQPPMLGYIDHMPGELPEQRRERHRLVAQRRAGHPLIFHRGAVRRAPENTLECYAAAIDMGADGVEIDVHRTRDGVLVLHHDDELGRTFEGHGKLRDKTYYELLQAKLKNRKGPVTDDTRMPTLAAFLQLARRRAMLIHLDVKQSGIQDDIIRMIERADMWDHLVEVNGGNADKIRPDVWNQGKPGPHNQVQLIPYAQNVPLWDGPIEDVRAAIDDYIRKQDAAGIRGTMFFGGYQHQERLAEIVGRKPIAGFDPLPEELRAWWGPNGLVHNLDKHEE